MMARTRCFFFGEVMCYHDSNQKFANFLRVALLVSALSVNFESARNFKITLFISTRITAICDTIYCISKEVKETDQGQYVSFLRPPVPRVNLQADLIADVLYALITKD